MFETPPQEPAASVLAMPSERLSAATPTLASLPNVVLLGYPISGRTRRSVRAEINERRPESQGRRHDARTTWGYSFRVGQRDGTCAPGTSEVTVSITVVMPDLENPGSLGREDRAAWNRYMTALEFHEANHARIANLGAEGIQQAMRAAASCDELRAIIDTAGQEVAAASQEYDRRTQHGATEGARF